MLNNDDLEVRMTAICNEVREKTKALGVEAGIVDGRLDELGFEMSMITTLAVMNLHETIRIHENKGHIFNYDLVLNVFKAIVSERLILEGCLDLSEKNTHH